MASKPVLGDSGEGRSWIRQHIEAEVVLPKPEADRASQRDGRRLVADPFGFAPHPMVDEDPPGATHTSAPVSGLARSVRCWPSARQLAHHLGDETVEVHRATDDVAAVLRHPGEELWNAPEDLAAAPS
jgi:hypothetical protein